MVKYVSQQRWKKKKKLSSPVINIFPPKGKRVCGHWKCKNNVKVTHDIIYHVLLLLGSMMNNHLSNRNKWYLLAHSTQNDDKIVNFCLSPIILLL